jgi:hypothetical protein
VRKRRENAAPSYTAKIEGHLRNYVLPALGAATPVGAITREDLKLFRQGLSQGDLELKTCTRILVTVRQLLKLADEASYCALPVLPMNFPEKLKDVWTAWTLLNPAQITAVLEFVAPEVRALFA